MNARKKLRAIMAGKRLVLMPGAYDALSARIFGYSTWSLLLPSAFAGAATVGLLWLIVRRYFGVAAATIAGLVLALTPIAVAIDRLNMPEPFYILALTGAAACVLAKSA